MFDLNGSFGALDEETRLKLAELLEARSEYLGLAIQLNALRVKALIDPSPQNEEAASDFASAVVATKRARLAELTMEMAKRSVDLDRLKGMLPMLLMGAMQSVNLPLLLTVFDVDPTMIKKITDQLSGYFKKGME